MWAAGILFVTASSVCGYVITEDDDLSEGIVWPSEYYLKGEKLDLTVGIKESFEIWYNAELNRSRVSYYDRLDSIYYYGTTDGYDGRVFKVFPKTSTNLNIFDVCEEENHKGDAEDFLPPIENFTYYGETIYNQREVKVWKYYSSDGTSSDYHILYIYRDHDKGVDVPVRYDTISHNEWTKALSGHSITEYHDFKLPDSSDLDVAQVESCENANIGFDLKKALSFYHPDVSTGLEKAFRVYKHHHKIQYDANEHKLRRQIFQKNWRKVIAHNKKNLSYKMAINQFSDRTPEELRYLSGTFPNPLGKGSVEFPHTEEEVQAMVEDLPKNYNMRPKGVINNVKNQGSCGSCWAYSTTAAVEGALARSNGGRNINLSEQSLVDCAWEFFNFGCDGGLIDSAFKYVLNYGIPTERDYGSYLAQDGKCALRNMTEVYKIKGFARITPLSIDSMKVALYTYGPVTVAIHAGENLSQYSSGIFYDTDCENEKRINHGVTVVGYGVRDGSLYWVVKNSWGEEWGEDGYALMSATNDNCLTLTEAYYPIV